MNIIEIIEKKSNGETLSGEEIRFFVEGYVADDITDYQAAAWCMAVYIQGMTDIETGHLTMALAESGEMLDFSDQLGFIVDKHSSGGVGDKTSLVVLPLVASFGIPVAKMSGRGLGFTGGTLDKLESISGMKVEFSSEEFIRLAVEHGIILAGQAANLAPGDGKLYALRDVTGTVASKPLIAASIMSKKLAAGANAIVLDVKVGYGAFMPGVPEARELAALMVSIGQQAGRQVTALISDMNQPLGNAVGNSLEVIEAIETLQGGGPHDFVEHSLVVAGHMLRLAGKSNNKDLSDILPELRTKLSNGDALTMFRTMVESQGGNLKEVDDTSLLPSAPVVKTIESPRAGYLKTIHAGEIGLTALQLGAGRKKKGDPVDHAVGLVIHHKVGERVEAGQPLFTVHARSDGDADAAVKRALGAYEWSDTPGLPLFYDVLFGKV